MGRSEIGERVQGESMTSITIGDITLEAAEANGLKCWPPESLGPTLEGYRKRVRMEGYDNHRWQKASHHRGRPKGGGLKQCKEGIDQRGNAGKR